MPPKKIKVVRLADQVKKPVKKTKESILLDADALEKYKMNDEEVDEMMQELMEAVEPSAKPTAVIKDESESDEEPDLMMGARGYGWEHNIGGIGLRTYERVDHPNGNSYIYNAANGNYLGVWREGMNVLDRNVADPYGAKPKSKKDSLIKDRSGFHYYG
jgi:hypothetical protein